MKLGIVKDHKNKKIVSGNYNYFISKNEKKEIFPIKYSAIKINKTREGKVTNKIIYSNYLYKKDIKKICINKSSICKY